MCGHRSVLMARKSKRPVKSTAARPNIKAVRKPTRGRSAPIDLYYWPTPNGWKISIMLEECRLPYNIVPVNISTGEQFDPKFLAISPNNRMPAIIDPDGPGGQPISIFESGAILQYLGRKTGMFYPADERARVEVDQWLFWQVGGLGPHGRTVRAFSKLRARADCLCDRPLHRRGQPPLPRDGPAPRQPRVSRRRLLDRRYGLRRLGRRLAQAGPGHRGVSEPQALARD